MSAVASVGRAAGSAVWHGGSAMLGASTRDLFVTAGTQIAFPVLATACVIPLLELDSPEAEWGAQGALLSVGLPIALWGANARWRALEPGDRLIHLYRLGNLMNVVGVPLLAAHVIAGQQPTAQASQGAIANYLIRNTLSRIPAQITRDFSNFITNACLPSIEPRINGMPLLVGSDLYKQYTATRLNFATTAYGLEVGLHQGFLRDEIPGWLKSLGVPDALADIMGPALSASIAEWADAITGVAAHYHAAEVHGATIHITGPKGPAAWADGLRYVRTNGSMRVFYFSLVEAFVTASNLPGISRGSLPWLGLRLASMVPHISSEYRGKWSSESIGIEKVREKWAAHQSALGERLVGWLRLARSGAFDSAVGTAVSSLAAQLEGHDGAVNWIDRVGQSVVIDRASAVTAMALLQVVKNVLVEGPRDLTAEELVKSLISGFDGALALSGQSSPGRSGIPDEVHADGVLNAVVAILDAFNEVSGDDRWVAGDAVADAAIVAVGQGARLTPFNIFDASANQNQMMMLPAQPPVDAGGQVAVQIHGSVGADLTYSLGLGLQRADGAAHLATPSQVELAPVRLHTAMASPQSTHLLTRFGRLRPNIAASGSWQGRIRQAAGTTHQFLENTGQLGVVDPTAAVVHCLLSALISIDWSSEASDAQLMDQLAAQFRQSPRAGLAPNLTDEQIFQSALALMDESLSNEAKEAHADVGRWLTSAALAQVQELLGTQGLPREAT
jgi:hypothetical protein